MVKFKATTRFVNIFNTEFNIIIYVLLVYAVFNAWWLSAKGIVSGALYISILTVGIVLVSFFNFTNIESKFKFATPFARTNNTAILRFFVGFILMLVVLQLFSGFSSLAVQSFQPLNSFRSTQAEATFSALQAQNSPFWTMNTIVVFASVFEEILIGVILVYIFYVILIGLFKNIEPNIALWTAIGMDVFAFAILHSFNVTYTTTGMYAIAGLFRFAGNVLIYIAGLGVEFMIGIHAASNAVFLGIDVVMSGLLSLGGIAIIMILVVFVYILFSTTNSLEAWVNLFKSLSYKTDSGEPG